MPAAIKPAIPFSALELIDIRVGTIQAVDEVPASKKLVRLTVSFGDHTRRILAGLKQERPDLTVLVGRQALFVVNLEPRMMAGEVSEGMLFDIGYADGVVPVLAVPETPVPDGSRGLTARVAESSSIVTAADAEAGLLQSAPTHGLPFGVLRFDARLVVSGHSSGQRPR